MAHGPWSMGMPKYKNKALTVGCHDVTDESRTCGTKTELMDMSSLYTRLQSWKPSTIPEFVSDMRCILKKLLFKMNCSIFGYSAASTETAAYIIGGMCDFCRYNLSF